MKIRQLLTQLTIILGIGVSIAPKIVRGQLLPDQTLGEENSQVIPNLEIKGIPSDLIDGGAKRGKALFQSFQEFNVSPGRGVYFINPNGIDNIFTRVTGNNLSNINGTIGVLGNANLFLINPNGIIFGSDARLDLNGAFTATTANSISLNNTLNFSASRPSNINKNIKINFPISFNFGEINSYQRGEIKVSGKGDILESQIASSSLSTRRNFSQGIEAAKGIYLIGRKLDFDGAIITATEGNIKLFSVEEGRIILNNNWEVNTEKVLSFQDISLRNRSLINVHSPKNKPLIPSGSIEIKGKNIYFDNSLILSQNNSSAPASSITIKALNNLNMTGVRGEIISPFRNRTIPNGIQSETQGTNNGKGADIMISAPNILLQQSAIESVTFSSVQGGDIQIVSHDLTLVDESDIISLTTSFGRGGNVNVQISNNLEILGSKGSLGINSRRGSNIGSFNSLIGQGGNLKILANNVKLTGGSGINTENQAILNNIVNKINPNADLTGKTGNLELIANDIQIIGKKSVKIFDIVPGVPINSGEIIFPSGIGSSNGGNKEAGDILIKADNILIEKSGRIYSLGFSSSSPANIKIETTNSLILKSEGNVISNVQNPKLDLLTDISTAPAGNIIIEGKKLHLDNAFISAFNQSLGNAGNITLNIENISLINKSEIFTTSLTQNGGNININNARSVDLKNNSRITASSEGITINANAGSINIDSDRIKVSGNSSIETNARGGDGGNINLNTNKLELVDANISANVGFIDANGQFQGNGNGGNITIKAPGGVITALDNSSITANATLGRGGNIRIVAAGLFKTPDVKIEAISRLGIDGVVEIDLETDNDSLVTVNRQDYQEYIKEVNLRCENQNKEDPGSQFGIKNTFPHKDFFQGGNWRFDIFLTTEEKSLDRDTWDKIIVPNAIIEGKNGDIYYGLVCATKVADY